MEDNIKIEFFKHYEPIHNQFCRFCRAISGNTEDSEDLIQETISGKSLLRKEKFFPIFIT